MGLLVILELRLSNNIVIKIEYKAEASIIRKIREDIYNKYSKSKLEKLYLIM